MEPTCVAIVEGKRRTNGRGSEGVGVGGSSVGLYQDTNVCGNPSSIPRIDVITFVSSGV